MRRTRLVTVTIRGVGKQAGVVQRGCHMGDFGGGAVMAMPQSAQWPWRRSKGGKVTGMGFESGEVEVLEGVAPGCQRMMQG